ncbi:hypothetical protein SAMN05216411_1293, partial [Nitrosospira multiformis]
KNKNKQQEAMKNRMRIRLQSHGAGRNTRIESRDITETTDIFAERKKEEG